jgi:hypothetical protein
MANSNELVRIENFVNTHDIGLTRPRAVLVQGGFVRIESIDILPDGTAVSVFDCVETLAQSRAVLGYRLKAP